MSDFVFLTIKIIRSLIWDSGAHESGSIVRIHLRGFPLHDMKRLDAAIMFRTLGPYKFYVALVAKQTKIDTYALNVAYFISCP